MNNEQLKGDSKTWRLKTTPDLLDVYMIHLDKSVKDYTTKPCQKKLAKKEFTNTLNF